MRTGRDLNNQPVKRHLALTCEELDGLKQSIKASVLEELRTDQKVNSGLEVNPNLESIKEFLKDSILAEFRAEMRNIPNQESLKASILSELRTELKDGMENEKPLPEQKIRELMSMQEGLLQELLDQKTLIKILRHDVFQLSEKVKELEKPTPKTAFPSDPAPEEDFLANPVFSPVISQEFENRRQPEASYNRRTEASQFPPLAPGTCRGPRVKISDTGSEGKAKEKEERKCEYIIAESGESRSRKQNLGRKEDYKCEYIIAERPKSVPVKDRFAIQKDDL